MVPGLTTHARARMQQRGIPESALDALLDFGWATRARSALSATASAGCAMASPAIGSVGMSELRGRLASSGARRRR